MEVLFLALDEVLAMHEDQLERRGGSPGVREPGLLQSALSMPQATAGGYYVHEDLAAMAGAYLFHLICNHPFVDGNKRTALMASLMFLDMNGAEVEVESGRLYEVVMQVANGSLGKDELAECFRSWSR